MELVLGLFILLSVIIGYKFYEQGKRTDEVQATLNRVVDQDRIAQGTLISISNGISENPAQDAARALEDIRSKRYESR